ncbi:MAG: DsbE family thiol:disulfide interchange protein [Xanthobacteraceae bacterium]
MNAMLTNEHASRPKRWVVLVPLVVFLGLAVLFFFRLKAGDPSAIPSALIGQPAPTTALPAVPGLMRDGKPVPGISAADLKGKVTVLNIWASWCAPCREEAPALMRMAADRRYRLIGLNYKDEATNAVSFLARFGNPFAAVGADPKGRAGIEWGVYGVPETFVIGSDGKIAYKLVGPITPTNLPNLYRAIEKALASGT